MTLEDTTEFDAQCTPLKEEIPRLTILSSKLLMLIAKLEEEETTPIIATDLVSKFYDKKRKPEWVCMSDKSFIKLKGPALSRLLQILKKQGLVIEDRDENRINYRETPLKISEKGKHYLRLIENEKSMYSVLEKARIEERSRQIEKHKQDINHMIDDIIHYIESKEKISSYDCFPDLPGSIEVYLPAFQDDVLYPDLRNHLTTFLDLNEFEKDLLLLKDLYHSIQKGYHQIIEQIANEMKTKLNLRRVQTTSVEHGFLDSMISWVIMGLHYKYVYINEQYYLENFCQIEDTTGFQMLESPQNIILKCSGVPLIQLPNRSDGNMDPSLYVDTLSDFMTSIDENPIHNTFLEVEETRMEVNTMLKKYVAPLKKEKLLPHLKGDCQYLDQV